ncbi:MAG: nicotinate-nicotinamide nucleotide adenylyltransferase, partial [Acidiferrobacterales bacterium]
MIGIFGGTFDPIHYGHLRPTQEIKQALSLKSLFLVPAAIPPHRNAPLATAAQRFHMVNIAIEDFTELSVDDCEIKRGGISYTVDTLRYF